jgi:hypothetical protein
MNAIRGLAAGGAGAVATTLVNEVARRYVPAAPRLDLLGTRGLDALAGRAGVRLGTRARYAAALAGDLLSNGLYFALAARARRPVRAGLALGVAAGLGAVVLAPALGFGRRPVRATGRTAALTVAWYTLGGFVAGVLARPRAAGAPEVDVATSS